LVQHVFWRFYAFKAWFRRCLGLLMHGFGVARHGLKKIFPHVKKNGTLFFSVPFIKKKSKVRTPVRFRTRKIKFGPSAKPRSFLDKKNEFGPSAKPPSISIRPANQRARCPPANQRLSQANQPISNQCTQFTSQSAIKPSQSANQQSVHPIHKPISDEPSQPIINQHTHPNQSAMSPSSQSAMSPIPANQRQGQPAQPANQRSDLCNARSKTRILVQI
jgi:hypothetical protein